MTVREPGGPTRYETDHAFSDLITGFKNAWQDGNVAEVKKAVIAIGSIIDSESDQALTCRVENRFMIEKALYDPQTFYLGKSISKDEPLRPDGQGPRVTGRIVSFTAHEIPGSHLALGNHQQISPRVPGFLIDEVEIEGGAVEGSHYCYLPLTYVSDPQLGDIDTHE